MAKTKAVSADKVRDYFRRDQLDGVSPPDLSKTSTYAEHVVHARGKRTQFTSVSLDLRKIRDFGDADYKLKRKRVDKDGHSFVEHEDLVDELRRVTREDVKAERIRAIAALRYVRRRKEGLVEWKYETGGLERKDLINWARAQVQRYFIRL